MIGSGDGRRVRAVALCLALLMLTVGSARAQAVRELTVDECVRLGLAGNASVRAAGADAAAAQASYGQVRASRLPAVRAQGAYTRLSSNIPAVEFTLPGSDSTFVFQGVELNRYDAQLTVEQPLFTGLQLTHRVRAARREADAAALDAEQARADVALEIRRAFWSLYRAEVVRASVAAAAADVEAHLQHVRNQLTAGAVLTRDLLAAETRRAEVLLARVQADNAVRVGQLELNRLIGLPLETPVRPLVRLDADSIVAAGDATSGATAERVPTAEAAQDPLGGGPQLAALAARADALRAQLRAVQGSRLPQLNLIGRYSYSRPNPYFFMEPDRFHHTWELGVSASWDLWSGGRTGAQAAEASARVQAAEARLADARAQVAVEVARQRLEVTRAAEAMDAARRNVDTARESFRVARQQFDEGAALSSDVLAAEQAYRDAQANRAGATADHAIARAALLHALGRVW